MKKLCVFCGSNFGTHPAYRGAAEGFYDSFLAQADRAVRDGFVSEVHRSLVISASDPDELLDRLEQHPGPQAEKWYNR
jgi:predicted Rossmann-fold nucleotide-binding protein